MKFKELTKKIIPYILSFVIILVLTLFIYGVLYVFSEPLRFCESKGWDGSYYIKKSIGKDIVAKCNKVEGTQDIIDFFDTIPFLKITSQENNIKLSDKIKK